MFEKCLIEHCSPTLAGIKTSNLFMYNFSSVEQLLQDVKKSNFQLRKKGIIVAILKKHDNNALIYVYRKNKLIQTLSEGRVAAFLEGYGYSMFSSERMIVNLKKRLSDSIDFPHEIGIFLGYPLDDVVAFIENSGRNCKCLGYWKVYNNECEAMKTFERYKKCTNVYMNLYKKGIPVTRLAVAS